jgi:MOSC domain-containing protein YiiM
MQGKVLYMCVSKENKIRKEMQSIEIDEKGILEDKFYGKDLQRTILISSVDSYELMKENGIEATYGSLGENIVVDINPYKLANGTKIEMGETIVEITQNCTICNSLAKVHEDLPQLLQNDRGIFAKTYKSGKILVGDIIRIL